MIKKRLGKQAKTYVQIREEWEKIQSLDAKNRFKAMRSIANDICEGYKKNIDEIEQLEFYIRVLKQIIRMHDYPRCALYLSKMIANWLALTGNDKAKIIKKISGKIPVETSIVISDVQYSRDIINAYTNYSERNLVDLINNGKAFIFHADIHDACNVQLRIVDSLEPVLTSKEFKCVVDTTETAIINIPTGIVAAANPWNLDDEKYRLSTNIAPGNYKVCVYLFYIRHKIESYYIVLCKTENAARNDLSKIHEIDLSAIPIH